MRTSYNLYNNLGYWFLLLIVLVAAGFYTPYFTVFFQPTPPLIHIHFTLMALWMGLLIIQPFLIKYKKRALHRKLGKLSYVVVPLVLLSTFLMIRLSYYRFLTELEDKGAQGLNHFTNQQLLQQAAVYEAIALVWLFLFALFYALAVINRRRSMVHARYMVAAALPLLGPTVDRIIVFDFKLEKLPGSIPIETAAFVIADMVLALLLWKDYKNNQPTKTLWTCLGIYVLGQALYYTVPGTSGWTSLVTFLMKPHP